MELDEYNENMLECEKPENIDKYKYKQLDMLIDDKKVIVDVYNKKDEDENNLIIKSIEKNAEPSEVSNNKYNKMKDNKSKSIGVVMYLQDKEYSDDEKKNLDIHIPHSSAPSFLAKIIKCIFEKLYETNIKELIAGHEHGEKNKKCHLQIIIMFEKLFRKLLKPGALKIKYENEIICLVYMQQKTKNAYALKNYCKKERDATIVKDDKYMKYEKEMKEDPYTYIIENRNNIKIEDAREKFLELDHETYFLNCNNIESAFKHIIVETPLKPFEWMPVPEYLKKLILPNGINFYDVFSEWYNKYCINGESLERKKALCLYSEKRAMGKSYFVRHLVSDPEYILEFNNCFCTKKNLGKGIYKLVLLDDMKIINQETKEMWKGLVASEPTTIRGAWVNTEFKERLPCIITTNDIEMVKIFRDDKLFNTQVLLIEITEYMGEPGTEREDLLKRDFIISERTANKLNNLNIDKNINNYFNL